MAKAIEHCRPHRLDCLFKRLRDEIIDRRAAGALGLPVALPQDDAVPQCSSTYSFRLSLEWYLDAVVLTDFAKFPFKSRSCINRRCLQVSVPEMNPCPLQIRFGSAQPRDQNSCVLICQQLLVNPTISRLQMPSSEVEPHSVMGQKDNLKALEGIAFQDAQQGQTVLEFQPKQSVVEHKKAWVERRGCVCVGKLHTGKKERKRQGREPGFIEQMMVILDLDATESQLELQFGTKEFQTQLVPTQRNREQFYLQLVVLEVSQEFAQPHFDIWQNRIEGRIEGIREPVSVLQSPLMAGDRTICPYVSHQVAYRGRPPSGQRDTNTLQDY